MKNRFSVPRLVLLASLLALAFGFGYLDLLIPIDALGIPGVKLGLANLVILASLYWLGLPEAAATSFLRILLFWFVFGNTSAFLYSLCGGLFSLFGMMLIKRIGLFDEIGVSVCGAVLHNVGQILMAQFLIGSYFPVLLLTGVVTGAVIGALFLILNRRLGKMDVLRRFDQGKS